MVTPTPRKATVHMILKARFPVFLAKCRPPGFRTGKTPAVLFLETSVEIEEGLDRSVPVVLSITGREHEQKAYEIRHRDGRFYKSSGLSPEAFEHAILLRPWARPEGLEEFIDELIVDVTPYSRKVCPPDVVRILQGSINPNFNQQTFIERSSKTVIEDFNLQAVESARRKFQNSCANFLVIGGKVWRECREPMLAVDLGEPNPEVEIFDGELPNRSPLTAYNYLSHTVRLFTLEELDLAKSVAAAHRKSDTSPMTLELNFRDISVFGFEYPLAQDAIRILSEFVNEGVCPYALRFRVNDLMDDSSLWNEADIENFLAGLLEELDAVHPMAIHLAPIVERLQNRSIRLDFGCTRGNTT